MIMLLNTELFQWFLQQLQQQVAAEATPEFKSVSTVTGSDNDDDDDDDVSIKTVSFESHRL